MSKDIIKHPARSSNFNTGAYSDCIKIDNFLFISGQASIDFETSKFIYGSIEDETYRTLENIRSIIETAGGTINDIVKVNVYLSDINNFNSFNNAYSKFFEKVSKPSRTTIGCQLAEGIKVEIDCIVKINQ